MKAGATEPTVLRIRQETSTDAVQLVFAGRDLTLGMVRRFVGEAESLPESALVAARIADGEVRIGAEHKMVSDVNPQQPDKAKAGAR